MHSQARILFQPCLSLHVIIPFPQCWLITQKPMKHSTAVLLAHRLLSEHQYTCLHSCPTATLGCLLPFMVLEVTKKENLCYPPCLRFSGKSINKLEYSTVNCSLFFHRVQRFGPSGRDEDQNHTFLIDLSYLCNLPPLFSAHQYL